MAYDSALALAIPPHFSTDTSESGSLWRVRVSTVSGVAGTDRVLIQDIPSPGLFITWLAESDTYINWAGDGVAQPTASATNGILLPGGVMRTFFHRAGKDTFVGFIQKSTGGNLYRWMSQP